MVDSLPNRIRELRTAAGLSAVRLGKLAKMAGPTVTRLETGERRLKMDQAQAIAQALGVGVEDVMGDRPVFISHSLDDSDRVKAAVRAIPQPRRITFADQVPVMGTAEGGENGFFELNLLEGAVEFVDAPPALTGVKQGELFAIRVAGTSMEPVWGPDDLVYIIKSRQPRPGSYVVALVERGPGDQPRALLKQLVRRDDEWVILKQHNPEKEVRLAKAQVKHLWRALHWRDLGL